MRAHLLSGMGLALLIVTVPNSVRAQGIALPELL